MTIGAEGLKVTPGSDIIIADGAEAFAAQCLRLWKDDLLRRRIAAAGARVMAQKIQSGNAHDGSKRRLSREGGWH